MKMLRFALVALTLALPAPLAPVCAQELAGLELVPVPLGTVSVAVHDQDGKPLAGRKILITLLGPTEPIAEGMTDRQGRFVIALAEGRYRLTVFDGEASVTRDFVLSNGELEAFRIAMPAPDAGRDEGRAY